MSLICRYMTQISAQLIILIELVEGICRPAHLCLICLLARSLFNHGGRANIDLRNIRTALPALEVDCLGEGLQVGGVARWLSSTYVHNRGGRCTSAARLSMGIMGGHHHGMSRYSPHGGVFPFLPSYVRVVYLDARLVRCCSVNSVAFHSFAWPRKAREAKSIARTLFKRAAHSAGPVICFFFYFIFSDQLLRRNSRFFFNGHLLCWNARFAFFFRRENVEPASKQIGKTSIRH